MSEELNTGSAPPPTPIPSTSAVKRRRSGPPIWAFLLILLGLLIIVGVGMGALLSRHGSTSTGGAEELAVNKLTTFTSPPTVPPDIPVVQENNTPLKPVTPLELDIAHHSFSVVAVVPEEGRWPIPAKDATVAVWLYGTVVNYVIGVPYTTSTESLLAGLSGGDRITLTLDNGTNLVFGSPQAQRIAATDTSPMEQQQPGLTLVLLGGEQSSRLVVQARYLPDETIATTAQQVNGVTVEVLKSGVVEDGVDTRHFVVEYRIKNEGDTELDTALFEMILEDGDGHRYPQNQDVTAQGEHGSLQGTLAPGDEMLGSAGYLIPRSTNPPLTWVFRPDPTLPDAAREVLPYTQPAPLPPQPQVEMKSAFVDGARNVIVIDGVIYNHGESPLTVTRDDLSLTSSSGSSSLQAITPLPPWTIESGGKVEFEVQFSRPANVSSVLFEALGFSFQLEGLP